MRDCVLDILNAWKDQTTNDDGATRLGGGTKISFQCKIS